MSVMPDIDVQRMLDATKRRSRQLRSRRRLLVSAVAVAVSAAIAIPVATLFGGSGRQAVIISPGPSTPPTTAAKSALQGPGPATIVTVPDVVGQPYDPTASAVIGAANLAAEYQLEHSATVAAGTVISQNPPAGASVATDSTVTLAVSIGPVAVPGTPPCRAANLEATRGEGGPPATGQNPNDWSFKNLANPCVLDGYPTVAALDTQGRVLAFTYTHSGDMMTTAAAPQAVYLPKGSSAWVRLNKYRCDTGSQDTTASLRLTLPSGGGTLDVSGLYFPFDYCPDTAGSIIAVSPFEPVEMLLFSMPNVTSTPLAVQLTAGPNPVGPGQKLTYTIAVTNLGSTPLTGVSVLFPLPDDWWTWSANCQGAGPDFTCTFGGNSTSPPPGPGAQLLPGQSQTAWITTIAPRSGTGPLVATVTASGALPSGQVVTDTATNTSTES